MEKAASRTGMGMGWIRRIYDWVIEWSNHRHSQWALFFIAFAEASFFPVPPDVLLIAMAVGASRLSLRFALICTVGSILGGIVGYGIGNFFWGLTQNFFFTYVPGFTPEVFHRVSTVFEENAFWAVFTAGFTPIPYKVFTVAAGAAQISFFPFLLASICSRSLRFFLIGFLMKRFGPPFKVFIDKYFNLLAIVFTVLLIAGFMVLKGFFH